MLLPTLLIFLAFAADRMTKWWAAGFLAENGPTEINAFLTIHESYNRGIAFGLLPGIGPLVGWFSILIVGGLFFYLTRLPRSMGLLRVGLALMIGGSLGNMVDRLLVGAVLDFIATPLRPGIFNVADVMINVGVIVALVGALWQREEETAVPLIAHHQSDQEEERR